MLDDACVSVFVCVLRGGWKYQPQEKRVVLCGNQLHRDI